jgi:phage shock protein A
MFGLFQRFGRAFGARLDGMIARVENHEALFESAVRELEATLGRAEREAARAVSTTVRLRKSLAEERDATTSWHERAVRESVEARGVECLRRSKRALRRSEELRGLVAEHEALERRLLARTEFLRRELAEFREQEALLRARQRRSEHLAEAPDAVSGLDLAELLVRWETHVRETELVNGAVANSIDDWDDEPRDAAEEAALVLELRELKEKTR